MPRYPIYRPRHDRFLWLIISTFSLAAISSLVNYAEVQRWKHYRIANSCHITGYGIRTDDGIIHRIHAEHVQFVNQWTVLTEYTCSNNGQTIWR